MKHQSQFVNSLSFRISGSVQIQAKERGMRTVAELDSTHRDEERQ